MKPKNLELYISWRDHFLNIIRDDKCKKCDDPRKKSVEINYENPLECGCRCEQVENLFTTVLNIEADINLLQKRFN